MFILAVVYVPFNQSTWGIFIYLAVSLPEVSESTNTVIALLLLQCGVIALESWLFTSLGLDLESGHLLHFVVGDESLEDEAEAEGGRKAAHGS